MNAKQLSPTPRSHARLLAAGAATLLAIAGFSGLALAKSPSAAPLPNISQFEVAADPLPGGFQDGFRMAAQPGQPTATATSTPFPSPTIPPTPWPTPTAIRQGWLYLPRLDSFRNASGTPGTEPSAEPSATPFPTLQRPWFGSTAIDVRHYDVRLVAPDPGKLPAYARADVQLVVGAQALDQVALAVEPAITVRRVEEAGAWRRHRILPGPRNHPQLTGDRLLIDLGRRVAPGETLTVTVDYAIAASTAGPAPGLSISTVYGRKLFNSLGWPYYTRFWLPSNDDPADPATLSIEMHVPRHMLAAANGRLVEGDYRTGSGLDADGLRVFRWALDEASPTYGFHPIIGPYDVRVEELCFNTDTVNDDRVDCAVAQHKVPLVYFYAVGSNIPPERWASVQKAADAMIYFSSALGPFPYPKLGFVQEPHPFNMEYPSLIALASNDAGVHEVLHHWWGDPLYIAHWGDLWISEGITTYLDGFYDEIRSGRNTACSLTEGRLNEAPDVDPNTQLSDVPYCKGAAAIHDLRVQLGSLAEWELTDARARALFLDVMADIWRSYRGRHLSTEAFIEHLETQLPAILERHGVTVSASRLTSRLRSWERAWFVRRLATPTPMAVSSP